MNFRLIHFLTYFNIFRYFGATKVLKLGGPSMVFLSGVVCGSQRVRWVCSLTFYIDHVSDDKSVWSRFQRKRKEKTPL